MESVEQMIKRLCPKGVKYEKLRDICEIRRGVRVVKKQLSDRDGYPVYQNSLTSLGMYQSSNRKSGTTFVICAGAAGEIGYCNTEFWAADDCSTVESDVLIDRFIYFYLMTKQTKLKSQVRKASVPRLSRDAIENLSIPVPPLEIQNRIVEVLDKMTTLTATLTAELEARKQQYEYYRNKLLTFNEVGGGIRQVAWKKISEIAQFPKTRIKTEMLTVDTYVGVESLIKDRGGKTKSSSVPEGTAIEFLPLDILIGNIRPYLKKIWLSDCQGGTNGDVVCIRVIDSKEIMSKYLYYILASDTFFDYDNSHAKGGKMPRGDKNAILAYNVPVPSLEEQARIVSILDRFEALTTDLQSGLPAEIEARRQQYEYYRNKLLAFEQSA